MSNNSIRRITPSEEHLTDLIAQLRADLAAVTAERDELRYQHNAIAKAYETLHLESQQLLLDRAAARAAQDQLRDELTTVKAERDELQKAIVEVLGNVRHAIIRFSNPRMVDNLTKQLIEIERILEKALNL